jgi:mannose-6-phosphate isomerase-like protein (cupin superfamily)
MNTAAFSVSEVNKLRQESRSAWLEFLTVPSLSMGVYHIPAGTDDRETHNPHDRDEIYVGISGKGRLTADGEKFDVEPNAIVFVKAGVEHYFHDVTDDLTVLVFFSGDSDRNDG